MTYRSSILRGDDQSSMDQRLQPPSLSYPRGIGLGVSPQMDGSIARDTSRESLGTNLEVPMALYDAERFLDHQVEQLESKLLSIVLASEGSGDITPSELKGHLNFILKHMPELAKVHYVSALNDIRRGEYEAALVALHRFFDYCLLNRERPMYQFALLNLAILESRFGHVQQALWAVESAIEIARENRDRECLSYALRYLILLLGFSLCRAFTLSFQQFIQFIMRIGYSWLYRLKRNHPSELSGFAESEKYLLSSLLGRTKELNLIYLESLGELTKTKQAVQMGKSPIEVFESIMRSNSLNVTYSLDSISGSSHLLNASVWDIYGN
ncbi:anaphase-promoting complex subunit 5-domain-containing protein [Jimgerdemannia flammicorona]|uniref:Anaphase-promoting complex subunit 5 n=1 Tax=Jimgerdemannia flammicorona TaxID=994334 RepID=A0A433QMR0_9FUNG|nr:anaphase-promoting complex subunit 5-domain-containing protein [Jimgerdemannia flammicorona]